MKAHKSLSNIPLKRPDPWAALATEKGFSNNHGARHGVPKVSAEGRPLEDIHNEGYTLAPLAPDNLTELSRELQAQYPKVKTQGQMWAALADSYAVPGRYQVLTKDKRRATQGRFRFADPSPHTAWSEFDTAFVPTEKQMASDPLAAAEYAPNRRFGVLAHEMRHIIGKKLAPDFMGDPSGNSGLMQEQDAFGNQYDHFPGTYTDRDMLNAFKALRVSQGNAVPDSVRVMNPWMGVRGHQPTKEDLMRFLGEQPGYKP